MFTCVFILVTAFINQKQTVWLSQAEEYKQKPEDGEFVSHVFVQDQLTSEVLIYHFDL